MPVKPAKGGAAHARGMLAAMFRLLTVASFVLMPLAMPNAPVAAAAREPAAVSMPCEGHKQPAEPAPTGKVHCIACVAIAEPDATVPAPTVQPLPVLVDTGGRLLLGLAPEVATPPPKGV